MNRMPLAPTSRGFFTVIEAIVVAFGRSPVVAVLGVGLVFSVFTAGAQLLALPWLEHGVAIIVIGLLVLLTFELTQKLALREKPIAIVPFLASSLIIGLAIRLIYVWYIRPEWYTDFLSYWQTGIHLASSEKITVSTIYDQRALFLTRPIIEIFGQSRNALVVINVVLLTFIQCVGYDLARRARDHQAAQAFSVLWIAVPEPLLTAVVPNHDLAGLALTALALWLLTAARATSVLRTRILYATSVGIVLAMLEVVRGLGLLFTAVLAALAIAAVVVQIARHGRAGLSNRRLRHTGLTLLVAFVSLGMTMNVLSRSGATIDPTTSTYLTVRYTTPHSTSLSPGTYSFYAGFDKAFTQDLERDVDKFVDFRRSIVLSDFLADPLSRIQAPIARMQRQYALGSQQSFYLRGTPKAVQSVAAVYTNLFRLGFALLLLVAIYRKLRQPVRAVTLTDFLLLFVATTSMTLLLFGENQPRYLFTIWFAGALVIPLHSLSDVNDAGYRSPVLLLVSAFAALGSLALLAFVLATGFKESDGRILSRWHFSNDLPDNVSGNRVLTDLQDEYSNVLIDPRGKAIPTHFGALSLKLMLPAPPAVAHVASADTEVCGIPAASGLEFQLASPWQGKKGTFSLRLAANGTPIWLTPLPDGTTPQRVIVALPSSENDCVHLQFSLRSHTNQSKRSWQRASFVEIFFPRIVSLAATPLNEIPGPSN